MVRRGSTVRVRQRALQKRRTSALSRSDRLAPDRTCSGYGAVYGAFKLRTPPFSPAATAPSHGNATNEDCGLAATWPPPADAGVVAGHSATPTAAIGRAR